MSYIRPFGDTTVDLSKIGAGTPFAGDPVVALIATVNRFPGQHFPVATGKVPSAVAIIALTYLQERLISAIAAIPDPGTTAQLTAIGAAFKDPVGFVTANLSFVTLALAGYADSKGLPPAEPNGIISGASPFVTAAAVGGVLFLAWMALR